MLSAHPSPGSGEPDDGPVLRPATPMTSIQQFESPDAAEAQLMADQRAAGPRPPEPARPEPRPDRDRPGGEQPGGEQPARGTARVRPAAPSGAEASGPAVADIQTTSGVPKVVIPAAVAAPADTGTTPAEAGEEHAGDAPEAPAEGESGTGDATDAAEIQDEPDPRPAAPAPDRPGDETDIQQVKSGKDDTVPQPESRPEVEVEAPAEREAHAEVEVEPVADPAGPEPDVEDTVVLRLPPAADDTVVLTLPAPPPQPEEAPPADREPDPAPRSPGEDTVVILTRAHDDTVVIPVVRTAATVAPPTEVVTAVIPVVPGRRDGQRTEAAPPPDPGRAPKPARARREPLDLGHAPAVLTISALGVLMVALAYAGGRVSTGNAPFAYWVGQVVVFTPVVVRLLSRRMAGVAESFLLVMGLALHQYLLKWMYSPDQFRFPDELQHWLATTIIVESGELFRPNPALPPAEHFPGLAELGAAAAEMTGLPVTAAGVVVAGIAHLVFVGVLFAVVLRASNSPAVAGVACATYATALHYLFFNSMFLYQTAALPFFMLTIWAVRRWRAEGGRTFVALAGVSMALTTVSHHVTALALVATLLLLAVAELVVDQPRRWSALVMPGAAAVVVAAWILLVATDVVGYLEEPVEQVRRTVAQLVSGESDAASASAPVSVGQLVVQGAGLLGLLVLALAVTRDMVHRRDRDWWRWAAVAGGLVFFAGNGVRFLGQNGPEIAGRLSTFTYVPISILAAIGLVRGVQLIPARDADGHRWRAAAPAIDVIVPGGWNLYSRVAAGSAMITLLMIGARAGGWPPIASILPGPYLAGGYERSVDAYGVASADWQRQTLGPGNRVGGDATSVSLASTYGRQDPVREVGPLYYADTWGLDQDDLAQRLHVQYLVVDRRLSTQLPESGAYFESDPRSGQITSPLTVGQLGKFDTLAGVDRLYDNGTVRIYRTGVQ
ncbi:hypothetical protein [Actinoplanes nipponensis]|nr:hypothetical protein [Actinoplanes nipponensis]